VHRQGRIDHEDEGNFAAERDWNEVLDRIVGQLLVHGCADRQRAAARHHDGVTVGRGVGAGGSADHRSGARPVLHHHRFAQPVRERLRDRAAERIDRAARRPRRNQGDLSRGVILCVSDWGGGEAERNGGENQNPQHARCRGLAAHPSAVVPAKAGTQ